jgi:S-(hydroxymethyl)glutathione dehydrogenase / alcohol dehydrogenase
MSISRRQLLKKSAAAAAGSAALAAHTTSLSGQGAAVVTARRFRAWVTRGGGPDRTTLQELTLRPISGRQIVVRTEATNLCYSNVPFVLSLQAPAAAAGRAGGPPAGAAGAGGRGAAPARGTIQGHGGVGIVEAVGPQVRRVQVGDRVCVSGTPQCGNCYQCLRGRADMCQYLSDNNLAVIAEMKDGTPVVANSHIGGLAELMITNEEWVVPVFTKAAAADVGMVCSCVTVAGLGATTSPTLAPVQPASTVAVVGCGPLGLSAVIGAKLAGAAMIIAIDPIRVRRELAQKLGATHALDPNAEGNNLVGRVRELTRFPTDRFMSGGRTSGGLLGGAGADYVIEAVGADAVPPKMEPGPDPTGILPMRQAYEMTAPGGHVITTSLPRGNITLPGVLFSIGGRTHHAGQAGGSQPMRDIPRYVEMLDAGLFNAKALATTIVRLEDMLPAYEQVAYRTTVTAIMTP